MSQMCSAARSDGADVSADDNLPDFLRAWRSLLAPRERAVSDGHAREEWRASLSVKQPASKEALAIRRARQNCR